MEENRVERQGVLNTPVPTMCIELIPCVQYIGSEASVVLILCKKKKIAGLGV